MNHKIWPHFLPLLTTLLSLQKCLSKNQNYVDCKPFECGSLNISYPFYVSTKQPSFCGSQGFNVSCDLQSQTIINLSSDDYIINHINYRDLSVNLTNSAFSSHEIGCLGSIHNLTFGREDKRFNFALNHKELLLVQNFTASSSSNYTKIECKEGGRAYNLSAVYEKKSNEEGFIQYNETVIEVPYDDEYEYNREQASADYIYGLLRKGILLKYYSPNNCSVCQDSGGRCLFDSNTTMFLCACPDRDHRGHCHKGHLKFIVAIVLPISAIIVGALALLLFVYFWRRGKNKSWSSTTPASRSLSFNCIRTELEVGSMHGVTVYSYTELEEATNNFDPSKHLGEGGFGVVYYGKLRDGREVAVKRLYEKSYKRIEQFKNEIRILTNLRHQYLVTLYGCTSRHTRELLLVYEYLPNGTVADHLHGEKTKSRLLPWPTRMTIAIETATALSYLHFNDIVHRDVKTNNILLDNNFNVKVADFGLSRLFPADVTHVSTAPQGTPGYVDPEYHQCYHLTDKSDVYSFGVVLIELISSLLAVDIGRDRHEINLSTYAMNRIHSSTLSDLIDPHLGYATNFKVRRMTTLVAELASQCLQHDRELRPLMEEVLQILKKIESEDYDAMEAEEANWCTRTEDTHTHKAPPSPTDHDGIQLLRNTRQPLASPISVMNKWVSSSKSTSSN